MQPNASTTIDRDALNLARSIGLAESGKDGKPNYNAIGDNGTSRGAYQFQPGVFESRAKQFGLNPQDFSPQNQDKVQYFWVKKKKDEGYQPWEIAAMHNAGEGRPDAWKDHVGRNEKLGVDYNTPAYVSKVKQRYMELTGSGVAPTVQAQNPTLLGDLSSSIKKAGSGITEAYAKGVSGEINAGSALLQGTGAVAKGVSDVVGDAITHTPVIGSALEKAGQSLAPTIQQISESTGGRALRENYKDFKQVHPEAAGNLEAVGNIASVVPVVKGGQLVKRGVQNATKSALYGSKDGLVDAISPRLGPVGKATAEQTRGTVSRGLLGVKDLAPDPRAVDAASIIRKYVPEAEKLVAKGENLKAASSLREGATRIRDAYRAAAKEAKGVIFPIKEYASHLRKLEIPDELVGDTYLLNQRQRIIDMAENIARKNGGSADSIVDTLSDFDNAIRKRWPSMYKSDRFTPLRGIVRDVREATKDYAEKAIPDLALREQMSAVHRLLDAAKNLGVKGTSGATSELGKHILSDKFKNTRGLIKAGVNKTIDALPIVGGLRLLD